jgi:dephospho-CoA kinase
MYVLGLTGPIASGKSFVEEQFKKLGASIIDTDKIVHKMYASDTDLAHKISKNLSQNLTNSLNTIDRSKLREHIKENPADLSKLEAIVYPFLGSIVSERLHALKEQQVKLCVLSVPMMFEGNMPSKCDSIACCSSPKSIRRVRALERENITESILNVLMAKQKSTDDYCSLSDHIIPTDCSKLDTTLAVKLLHNTLLESM